MVFRWTGSFNCLSKLTQIDDFNNLQMVESTRQWIEDTRLPYCEQENNLRRSVEGYGWGRVHRFGASRRRRWVTEPTTYVLLSISELRLKRDYIKDNATLINKGPILIAAILLVLHLKTASAITRPIPPSCLATHPKSSTSTAPSKSIWWSTCTNWQSTLRREFRP